MSQEPSSALCRVIATRNGSELEETVFLSSPAITVLGEWNGHTMDMGEVRFSAQYPVTAGPGVGCGKYLSTVLGIQFGRSRQLNPWLRTRPCWDRLNPRDRQYT